MHAAARVRAACCLLFSSGIGAHTWAARADARSQVVRDAEPPSSPYERTASADRIAFNASFATSPGYWAFFDSGDSRWTYLIARVAAGFEFRTEDLYLTPGLFYELSTLSVASAGLQLRLRYGLLLLESGLIVDATPALGGRLSVGIVGPPIGLSLEAQRRTLVDGPAIVVGINAVVALSFGPSSITKALTVQP